MIMDTITFIGSPRKAYWMWGRHDKLPGRSGVKKNNPPLEHTRESATIASKISSKEQKELMGYWEKELKDLDERLSASGPAVEVKEPSNLDKVTVSFPPKRGNC